MPTATLPTADLAVYAARLARAQAELARHGADALLVGPSADFFYLTGYNAHTSERLTMLVLPAEGDPAIVVPTLEAPLLADRRDLFALHVWTETEPPTAIVAGLAGSPDVVAVGDQLWTAFLLKLQAAIPGARWLGATEILRPLRMLKDAREVALMREVGRRTDEAWAEFVTRPLSGQTEAEAIDRLSALTRGNGVVANWGICASGPNSASPHHHTGDRVIQPGDAVVFDWGGTLEGYFSDVTRTVHVGEPEPEFRRVYDLVLRANQATLDAVRPGVECQELDRVARNLIAAEGYGDAFIHRVGHGLGLEVHEEPYLVSGNTMPLAEGMVFSDEPGVYLAGRFGVRIEDAVVCTATGGERLNEATRDLLVLE